jgi:CubicO group peptidase (beta-lactamase class C family)
MNRRSSIIVPALAALALFAGCAADPKEPIDKEIDAIFDSANKGREFNGNVLVMRGGQTIYERSFGLADAEKNILNTPDTRFLAFSVVKPLTAVLIFQLVDTGRLRLSDTLDSFLPNLASKPAGRITLHQLLTHTSGLPEVISGHLDRRITSQDLETAVIKPDAGFEYSSTGYVVLGLVLEAVTGRTYEALMQESILTPAGMEDSGLVRSGLSIPNLAIGYHLRHGELEPAEMGVAMEVLDGAGSLYTTARDLSRFDQALAAETILSRKMQDLMLTQQVKGRYGYGWFLSEQGGRYFPWHKGDYRGYAAMFVRQIHRQEVIVILSNLEEADVSALRTKVLRALKDHSQGQKTN